MHSAYHEDDNLQKDIFLSVKPSTSSKKYFPAINIILKAVKSDSMSYLFIGSVRYIIDSNYIFDRTSMVWQGCLEYL